MTCVAGIAWGFLAVLPGALSTTYTQAVVYLATVGVIVIGTNTLVMSRIAQLGYVTPLPVVLVLVWSSHSGMSGWPR